MADNNMVISDEEDEDDSVDSEWRGDMSLRLAENHERSAVDRMALKEMQASLNTQEEESAIKVEEFEATLCQDITGNAEIHKIIALVDNEEQKLRLCQGEGKEQQLALLSTIYEREKQDLLDRLFLSKDKTKKRFEGVKDRVLAKWLK